jgi:hypothetical protein
VLSRVEHATKPFIHAASKNPADGYNAALCHTKSTAKARFPQVFLGFSLFLPKLACFLPFFLGFSA